MTAQLDLRPGQSIELLKELHILTREGKINQDSRRKLKQVDHLFHFIEPLLKNLSQLKNDKITLVDHGAGKSYLGFIIYDLFFNQSQNGIVFGVETRNELIEKSKHLAEKLGFHDMHFLNLSVHDSITATHLPNEVDIVTALHACDTATDDAIDFALSKKAKYLVLVPCCQAEVATMLRKNKNKNLGKNFLTEIYRHPIHTREFGSHLTNILRCLKLESAGYQVTVTELIGWEHSMKNELIIAEFKNLNGSKPFAKIENLLEQFDLNELGSRFLKKL